MNEETAIDPFNSCTVCKKDWATGIDFLDDPGIEIIAYRAHFEELAEGLFLFNHSCSSTISMKAGAFLGMYDGPMFSTRLNGTDECPGYCLDGYELRPCPAKCRYAYVRDVVQIIKGWPKMDWLKWSAI